MNKFVVKMLELGGALDKAVNPIEINMIINDAEILYKNHIEQLNINGDAEQIEQCCEPLGEGFYLGTSCPKCNRPFRQNIK